MAPMYPNDITNTNNGYGWANNTSNADWTWGTPRRQFRGVRVNPKTATVRLTSGQAETPPYVNVYGIEYKRVTRRGRHHYYRHQQKGQPH